MCFKEGDLVLRVGPKGNFGHRAGTWTAGKPYRITRYGNVEDDTGDKFTGPGNRPVYNEFIAFEPLLEAAEADNAEFDKRRHGFKPRDSAIRSSVGGGYTLGRSYVCRLQTDDYWQTTDMVVTDDDGDARPFWPECYYPSAPTEASKLSEAVFNHTLYLLDCADPCLSVQATAPVSSNTLTDDSEARKGIPMYSGLLAYFPDALAEVARLSKAGNDKHNPGQPLHWSKDKSNDHADCIVRHQVDFDKVDSSGFYHATNVAWRALAQLQTLLEAQRT